MQCRGFLFDLDGTLVDSLPVVERSWCHWADRQGIDHQDVLNFIHGKQAITSLRHFLAGRSEEEIQAEFKYLEQIEATDTEGITALPGARELLEHLNEAQIPWAIVTSGSVPATKRPVYRSPRCSLPLSALSAASQSRMRFCLALNCWASLPLSAWSWKTRRPACWPG